jgi:hypothetical protein
MSSPPRIHYLTMSGDPPNGGVPPGVYFSAQPPPGFVAPRPDMPWASSAVDTHSMGAPPPYQAVPDPHPSFPVCYGPAIRRPVTVGSFPDAYPLPCLNLPPTPSSAAATYFVPPGSSLNGVTPDLDGFAYIFPPDDAHTTINFAEPPARPCDNANSHELINWSRHKVPTTLTVSQLIEQLGGIGDADGVTEIYEQGDGKWAKGMTYTKNGEHEDKMLKEIGWTKRRGDEAPPVFLCCKRG